MDGKLYVMGGASGNDNSTGEYCTVVDNWRYDPTADSWQRLADLPVSGGNFPDGRIVFEDRYMFLVGGFQYPHVLNPDGTTREPYGTPTRHYPDNPYCSDVYVYDTVMDEFGRATLGW